MKKENFHISAEIYNDSIKISIEELTSSEKWVFKSNEKNDELINHLNDWLKENILEKIDSEEMIELLLKINIMVLVYQSS